MMSENNTPAIQRRVMRAAVNKFGRIRMQADFEHGQWWLSHLKSGAQYSVVDCQTQDGIDYLDFEQVSTGDSD